MEWMPFLMFFFIIAVLMSGFPVAFGLAGGALLFAAIGYATGFFDASFLGAIPSRIYGIMTNETLIAVPLFVFMGVILERGKISEELLESMGRLFGKVNGGLAVSVCIVGAILAASTGIVGATMVTMGLISLPVMLRYQYRPSFACGVITASGTLGQIIPPSIVLVILGDVISNANQQAQLSMDNFSPKTVSVGDLFFGALFPGLLLVGIYILYVLVVAFFRPQWAPAMHEKDKQQTTLGELLRVLVPPIFLIVSVLGVILAGIATPTEAAAVGAGGALVLAMAKKRLTLESLTSAMRQSTRIVSMIFLIFIGASIFSLIFRGFGGDVIIQNALSSLPGGLTGAFIAVMLLMFFLGFFLDFIEIIFVIVPLVAPVLIQLGADPIWLGVMIAINLQTSFMTPPFGFSLFYLRSVAPKSVSTMAIYCGALPFVALQLLLLGVLWFNPGIVTWLPQKIYG